MITTYTNIIECSLATVAQRKKETTKDQRIGP